MRWIILADLALPWFQLACAAGVYVLAWIRWRRARRLERDVAARRCLECGYPLAPSWPCPECGTSRGIYTPGGPAP